MQASLHAHTREWSGNPAVLGCHALRPVALRPRLSNGFALIGAQLGLRTCPIWSLVKTRGMDRISRSRCHNHGRLGTLCLAVWHLRGSTPERLNRAERRSRVKPPRGTSIARRSRTGCRNGACSRPACGSVPEHITRKLPTGRAQTTCCSIDTVRWPHPREIDMPPRKVPLFA